MRLPQLNWPSWVGPWVAGVACALAGFAGSGFLVVATGAFNATAATPHLPGVTWIAHTAMIRSVKARARDIPAPAAFTADQVATGFRHYEEDCVGCHGGPGVSRVAFASAMLPTPPYLLDASRRWSPGELYWIVSKGVKMTAMPAWGETHSRDEIWDIVAFLEALPRIAPADYARMRAESSARP